MKKVVPLFLALLFVLFSSQTLCAMSIGLDGEPYWESGIEWQGVKYENYDTGFVASLPGAPVSGLSDGNVYTVSKYEGVYYQIKSSLQNRYTPPRTEAEFVRQVKNAFSDDAKIKSVASNQKRVKYIVEILLREEKTLVRLFCSKNCLYWAVVQGDSFKIAPLFFEKIQISR